MNLNIKKPSAQQKTPVLNPEQLTFSKPKPNKFAVKENPFSIKPENHSASIKGQTYESYKQFFQSKKHINKINHFQSDEDKDDSDDSSIERKKEQKSKSKKGFMDVKGSEQDFGDSVSNPSSQSSSSDSNDDDDDEDKKSKEMEDGDESSGQEEVNLEEVIGNGYMSEEKVGKKRPRPKSKQKGKQEKKPQPKVKVLIDNKVTKSYKKCIMKAQKYISYSQDNGQVNKDFIKYYINKAMDYYKQGFQHCRSSKDTARLYVLLAESHIDICPRQYEHDQKGKHLAKACECLKNALQLTNEFNSKIIEDHQPKIIQLINKNLIQKTKDAQLLCTIMEIIYAHMHTKMKRLNEFLGKELYHVYYKIACDIIESKGDLENAFRYLKQCKEISKDIGIQDNQVISMKLSEIKKMKNRRAEQKNVSEAKNCIKAGDCYYQNGQNQEALQQYKESLKLCKDKNTEIEAISHFKIGRLLLHINKTDLKVLNQSKNNLIDFQILCHDVQDKSLSLQKKQREAKLLLQHISDTVKKITQPLSEQKTSHKTHPPKQPPKPKLDMNKVLKELEETSGKPIFELFKYLKTQFKDKTSEIQIEQLDRYNSEKCKVRKIILKFISVFHPDKQCNEDKEFFRIAEEITKQLNHNLKHY